MIAKKLPDERNYVEVDIKQVRENTKNIKMYVKDALLMSVIKGNAYGLGIEKIANGIEEFSDWFAVSTAEEALLLRENGIEIPILVLGYVSNNKVSKLIEKNITITAISYEYIKKISSFIKVGQLDIHIKIDTGLSRLGIYNQSNDVGGFVSEIKKILDLDNIRTTGIYTHFAVAGSEDPEDVAFTEKQYRLFKEILDETDKLKLPLGIKHICNSDAIFDNKDKYLDMVRVGKYIFGFGQKREKDILNVITPFNLYARIVRIVEIPVGKAVGYGRTYVTDKQSKLATITFGFTDGYRRNMSGKTKVIVNEKKVDVVGRIAADYMMVDVTNCDGVKVGDYALLVGKQGSETLYPDEIAKTIEGSTNELATQMHERIPRIYINE